MHPSRVVAVRIRAYFRAELLESALELGNDESIKLQVRRLGFLVAGHALLDASRKVAEALRRDDIHEGGEHAATDLRTIREKPQDGGGARLLGFGQLRHGLRRRQVRAARHLHAEGKLKLG